MGSTQVGREDAEGRGEEVLGAEGKVDSVVDTDEGDITVHVRDGGLPTVVLAAGAAMSGQFWKPVVEELSDLRVVYFDRTGLGRTRWDGDLPELAEDARTLAEIIEAQPGPVILVAHSMAAFHAEACVRANPDLVSGLVLLDPSVEWPTQEPPEVAHRLSRKLSAMFTGRMPKLGRAALVAGTWFESHLSVRQADAFLRSSGLFDAYARRDTLAAALAEPRAYAWQAWDLMAWRREPWPEVPVVVLTAGNAGQDASENQVRLARLLGGRVQVVEDSHHLMMLDAPATVARAVRSLVPDALG